MEIIVVHFAVHASDTCCKRVQRIVSARTDAVYGTYEVYSGDLRALHGDISPSCVVTSRQGGGSTFEVGSSPRQ